MILKKKSNNLMPVIVLNGFSNHLFSLHFFVMYTTSSGIAPTAYQNENLPRSERKTSATVWISTSNVDIVIVNIPFQPMIIKIQTGILYLNGYINTALFFFIEFQKTPSPQNMFLVLCF